MTKRLVEEERGKGMKQAVEDKNPVFYFIIPRNIILFYERPQRKVM